ncbi:TIGR00159 family protein [Malonomonas rubra DSM 5091]|uniref:Diadenylate cyclase n=1 Tax=Malonomonas rubra DSM 5091 TaxID=1122189 RepID=A0A1M6MG33_MALRU|nr:diadenylate cyclase [Malonomonas rubra]SHJ82388.1 TIGR00159 family protein [Malonomonas rubra DSM 5091]
MFWDYLSLVREIRWDDSLDIGLATLFLALGFHVLRSARTRAASAGAIFFAAVYFLARQLDLQLTTWLLQGIAAVLVLLLIVIFQPEIRRFLEQFPSVLFFHRLRQEKVSPGFAQELAETLKQLSAESRGALIVLTGRDILDSHLSGGIKIDGLLSKALLLSIFDPNSPGHDGGLVVKDNRALSFGVRLPLSDQLEKLHDRGTRHAAALGLAERTDAMVLVVSEETSRLSIAYQGDLQVFTNFELLVKKIDQFLRQNSGEKSHGEERQSWLRWYGKDLSLALFCSLVLWLVLVPAAVVENITYQVPIVVQNIPDGFVFRKVEPHEVAVTLTGQRRDLFQLDSKKFEIRLDATLSRFGRKTFPITQAHLLLPPEIEINQIRPADVKVSVDKVK